MKRRHQPPQTSLAVSDDIVEVVDFIWKAQRLDDAQLRNVEVQRAFAFRCAVEQGSLWRETIADLRFSLGEAPHWAVLRLANKRPALALLAAVGTTLGTLCDPYSTSWSRVLQEIATKKEWTPDVEWHTDSTSWPVPNRITALSCVRPARQGGATDLLSLASARAALAEDDGGALDLLESAQFAWPQDENLGGGTVPDLILAPHRVRFMREPLLRDTEGPLRRAVCRLSQVIDGLEPDISILLDPGDLLLFDNERSFHRRGWIEDPDQQRRLVRTKIM